MKKTILALLLIVCQCENSYSQPASVKINEAFARIKCNDCNSIKPNIDCSSVDSCYASYKNYHLTLTKWIESISMDRAVYLNNKSFKLVRIRNKEEDVITSRKDFPDYNESKFFLREKQKIIIIVSNLPSCTGISCQYRICQILDLEQNICYEKIIRCEK